MKPVTTAIVRVPGSSFVLGLTSGELGRPDRALALAQHDAYCTALEACGVDVVRLPPDEKHPDSTFVEDTAVIADGLVVLARPGAPSRQGEVAAIRPCLESRAVTLRAIDAPGTLDGGDVCRAGRRFFIGISSRTNRDGANQLAAFLRDAGFDATFFELPSTPGILHLKSGLAHLGDDRLAVIDSWKERPEFAGFEIVPVPRGESYAANCLRVNDRLLVAAGFPRFEATLRSLDIDLAVLEVSEFRKMDGGLSCLSLRLGGGR